MGQYYLGYVKHNDKIKVFDNQVDGEWTGLKLMEHSLWLNDYVANVVNDLFYNKGNVCWVGDYFEENNYEQVNCKDRYIAREIYNRVWNRKTLTKTTQLKDRYLTNCLIVNHTKKLVLVCDDYYKANVSTKTWGDDDKEWNYCVHPLPLLTCTAGYGGGGYYGTDQEYCGTWFNDEIEIVLAWDLEKLTKDKGYKEVMYYFKEE